MKLVTADQMRELERAAVEAGATEMQLMEEAGLAVAQEAWMLLGSLEGRRIVVLAGPGNNGGDGIVAARNLADWGADVAVYFPRRRRDESMNEELVARDIPLVTGDEDEDYGKLESLLAASDLVIDAILGIGQKRAIDREEPIGQTLARLEHIRKAMPAPKLIAVDLPTGLNADSGEADPLTVTPDLTVTFGLPKVGMYQDPGSRVVGRVQVIDIGIPKAAQAAVDLELLTSRWFRGALPERPEGSNKGTFGKVMVLGGSTRYPGAPRLAAVSAYRAGAGLVTIATTPAVGSLITSAVAEATWLPQNADVDGFIAPTNAISLRHEWRGVEAAIFGPGLGELGIDDGTGLGDPAGPRGSGERRRDRCRRIECGCGDGGWRLARAFERGNDAAPGRTGAAAEDDGRGHPVAAAGSGERGGGDVWVCGCAEGRAHGHRERRRFSSPQPIREPLAGDRRQWRRTGGHYWRVSRSRVHSDGSSLPRGIRACGNRGVASRAVRGFRNAGWRTRGTSPARSEGTAHSLIRCRTALRKSAGAESLI